MSPTWPTIIRPSIGVAAGLFLAVGASQAVAAPVSASGPGESLGATAPPAAQLIRKLSTTVDPATGAWSTAVTFSAAQNAADATAFNVALMPVDSKSLIAT
jgi:hypothetical protein